jgi:hypothetical protein
MVYDTYPDDWARIQGSLKDITKKRFSKVELAKKMRELEGAFDAAMYKLIKLIPTPLQTREKPTKYACTTARDSRVTILSEQRELTLLFRFMQDPLLDRPRMKATRRSRVE